MKKLIFMFLFIGAAISFWSCSENNSTAPEVSKFNQVTNSLEKKSIPHLIGMSHTIFTLTPPVFWNGTIDFGEGGMYGITFISYEPPRDFSQASPFYEDFYIYELGTAFDLENPTNVYMKGWNSGVLTLKNNKFRANGEIDLVYPPFEMWLGRKVHVNGEVIWNDPDNGFPKESFGTMRIN